MRNPLATPLREDPLDASAPASYSRAAGMSAMVSIALHSFLVSGEWWAISPRGSIGPLLASDLLILPLTGALVTAPLAALLAILPPLRAPASRLALQALVYLGIGVVAIRAGSVIRMSAFRDLAQRSAPLVEAIRRFEAHVGHAPRSLDDLVPEQLPAVPGTGMGAYPAYEYVLARDSWEYDGNDWILKVRASSGFLNWDEFLYFPSGEYPERGYGGSLESVGDWAYVHE